MEAVTDFIFLSSKITVDSDCRHEIRSRLLLGRKTVSALAGGVIAVLPVLIVYLIAQNKIIEGMSSAGIKG